MIFSLIVKFDLPRVFDFFTTLADYLHRQNCDDSVRGESLVELVIMVVTFMLEFCAH